MDKYYTKKDILDKVKDKIKTININEDKIIDFSCGNNYLCHNLFIDYGMEYVAYDIDPCENHMGKVIVKDFLKVKPHDIEKCIIVLNPPFGKCGAEARKFIEHSLKFKPNYIFIIIPNVRWYVDGYDIIESIKLEEESFVLPNGKAFKWPTNLLLLKRLPDRTYSTQINKYIKTRNIFSLSISRRMNNNHTGPLAIIRRAGRNAGKQSYIKDENGNISYRYEGKWIISHWDQQKHSIEGECFLKIYLNNDSSSTLLLKNLCELVEIQSKSNQTSSNIGYITNDFVINIFNQIVNQTNI